MIAEKIYQAYEQAQLTERERPYLGASEIGSCSRYLWLKFHGCFKPKFDGRTLRVFQRGNLEEERIINDLRLIGLEIRDRDEDGKQFSVESCDGHLKGHIDGAVKWADEWFLLEIKTMNDKNFADVIKKGVRKSHPKHWFQMQMYMHLTGLQRALYIPVNKNDEQIHNEVVERNMADGERLQQKAELIINGSTPPLHMAAPNQYPCAHCDAMAICHNVGVKQDTDGLNSGGIMHKDVIICCRNCLWARPVEGGQWVCDSHEIQMPDKPCDRHSIMDGILLGYELAGKDGQAAIYSDKNCSSATFRCGYGPDTVRTETLKESDPGIPF